jgi:hypothetical protein
LGSGGGQEGRASALAVISKIINDVVMVISPGLLVSALKIRI